MLQKLTTFVAAFRGKPDMQLDANVESPGVPFWPCRLTAVALGVALGASDGVTAKVGPEGATVEDAEAIAAAGTFGPAWTVFVDIIRMSR